MAKKAEEKKAGLEENFRTLSEYIEELEKGELSLEESFQKYTKGMELVKECSEMIDQVEKKLIVLEEEA